jgi:Domain of unknown function (DUF6894)
MSLNLVSPDILLTSEECANCAIRHGDEAVLVAEELQVVRCYFHLLHGRVTLPDEEGIELPDDDWEREIARIIEEVRSEAPELFRGASGWTIQVVDDQGREVARYPL